MKLSFSTRGWGNVSFERLMELAADMHFSGIELYDPLKNPALFDKSGPFHRYRAAKTLRQMQEKGLCIPCIDTSLDVTQPCRAELEKLIEIAALLQCRQICVRLLSDNTEALRQNLLPLLPQLEARSTKVLLRTSDFCADTGGMAEVLSGFACDEIGVLWDVFHPCFYAKEDPALTIKNLGARVSHVHMRDFDEDGHYTLIGEGLLPARRIRDALSSINFDGFVSLEWKPEYMPDLTDPEVIFPHFVSFLHALDESGRQNPTLYFNQTRTGQYVWKKNDLIRQTFPGVLKRMAQEFPDKTAIRYTTLNYTRTYLEFLEDVERFSAALLALGVGPGSHVAVWCSNLPEWFIAFWGCVHIGAVLVSMNTAYKISEAEYLLRQSDTHTLILEKGRQDNDYSDTIARLCPELSAVKKGKRLHARRLPFLRNVITVGFDMPGGIRWEDALEMGKTIPLSKVRALSEAVQPDDVCNMQYTSGTTGFPKGVMLTHYNVVNNGKCIGDRMDLSTADRMMIQVPMFHCFGMVLSMTASMTHGAAIYPLPYFSAGPALSCIHREHITAVNGVPTMFMSLMEHPDFARTDFSHMRTGIMAGSPCPIAKMRDVVDKMHMTQITIVYGQTEASPGCTMSEVNDSLEVRVGTVGRALPQIECRIVDPETNQEMPIGQNGEFVARGYNIMKGYYKMPDETNKAIDSEGWLHTGDLACQTPEGNFRITGRLKDMIIRGGENIYPKEIEEFIYTNEKVSDVQVVGVPDENYGEEILACVILKEGQTMTEAELKQFVSASMARHKVPRYVSFMDAFPMNAAGKILKYQLRKDAVERLGLQKAENTPTA